MATIEVKVPDIGDFKEVAVIELLVKPGDTVKVEQSLITVESDKASMEIPSSAAGVVVAVVVVAAKTEADKLPEPTPSSSNKSSPAAAERPVAVSPVFTLFN